jgi:putative addiction module killer protein
MIEVRRYVDETGKDIFGDWLEALKDGRTKAKVAARIARVAAGNLGDCKSLREGVWELRVNWGPGYRVYYGMAGRTCVLLLCGGEKRTQAADIKRAVEYWHDYKRRSGTS